jgi:hypothetical protein
MLSTQQIDDDIRLYILNSCRIGTEYQIRIELQHDTDHIAVCNRIATIKKQAEELLAAKMVKGAKSELDEVWGWKSDLAIRVLFKLTNYISQDVYKNEKLTESERNDTPAQLRPMHSILSFLSTLEERGDFFGKFVQEPQEDFNFFIAQMYGVTDLETHMTSNGPKLVASQRARHHTQRTVHWLEKSVIPATIDLEDRVANQTCGKKLERKIEAAGKERSKFQVSEATDLALAEHADRNMEHLEQE